MSTKKKSTVCLPKKNDAPQRIRAPEINIYVRFGKKGRQVETIKAEKKPSGEGWVKFDGKRTGGAIGQTDGF